MLAWVSTNFYKLQFQSINAKSHASFQERKDLTNIGDSLRTDTVDKCRPKERHIHNQNRVTKLNTDREELLRFNL